MDIKEAVVRAMVREARDRAAGVVTETWVREVMAKAEAARIAAAEKE